MLNKVMLIGNLGKDPEIKTTESGVPRAHFTLATNETYKDRNGQIQKNTEWHDIVLWRGLADRAKYLRKGMLIYLEGKLSHRKWTDRDGKDHYSTEVAVDVLRILEKLPPQGGQGNPSSANQGRKEDEGHNDVDFSGGPENDTNL
jgi:single-strand DNA-binding protein